MENGFSSPRSDTFPAGLRVLVVDDDPTWLKILEKMLKKCSYEVTTCGLARDALYLLRDRKYGYDIVISDVNMPDMDGFKLLEHVGLEMDLPVIMMSVDGETSRVMKGVQHGACDYLLKPIRMKELKNIWQHVLRKKILEVRDIESYDGTEGIQLMRHGSDQSDDDPLLSVDDLTSSKKRKDADNKYDEKEFGDLSSCTKKARVVWTVDLHQKFVKAVNQIGFDKVGPKKILDLMNMPWLTRENVASHLQKYRLYLSRLQKENDCKASFVGIKHYDLSPKDQTVNFCHQNSFSSHLDDAASADYVFPGKEGLLQNVEPKSLVRESKGIVSVLMRDTEITFGIDAPNSQRAGTSIPALSHQLVSSDTDMKYAAFDSGIQAKYSWSDIPEIQFKKENKLLHPFEDSFGNIQLPSTQNHIHAGQLQPAPSFSSLPSIAETITASQVKTKSSYSQYRSDLVSHSSPSGITNSGQAKIHVIHKEGLDPISTPTESSFKNQTLNQNQVSDLESSQKNLLTSTGLPISSLDEEFQGGWFQGDCYNRNIDIDLQNIEFPEYINPEITADFPIQLYDVLRFDYELPHDTLDYCILDQGLFIA